MFIVGLFVFFIIHLIPGNPAAMMLGPEATPEEIDAFSRSMGLDRPIPIQFVEWISNIVKGDFGTSLFFQGQQVTKVVFEHFKVTLTLTVLGVVLAIILGITTGVIAAINHNNILDRIIMIITSAGVSIPNFWLGFGQTSLIARMTRSNMLEVLRSDYVRTAKAKGLSELMVNYKHALKNVLIPVITIIGLSFANLMGGAVVTEQIFNIPGLIPELNIKRC